MAKEKSLVEEAIIQMKNLEETVAENAKGILASTMKQEINELVKESLSEQEEDELEVDTEVDMEEPEGDDMDADNTELDMDDEDMDDEDMDMDNMGMDDMDMDDEDTIDLTDVNDDDEILRVFSLAGPEDNIVVVKDNAGNINLKDSDKEYMIVGEGEEDMMDEDDMYEEEDMEEGDMYEEEDMEEGEESIESIVERIFMSDDEMEDDDEDFGTMRNRYFSDEDEFGMGDDGEESLEVPYDELDMEDDNEFGMEDMMEDKDEIMYEIVMDEEDEDTDGPMMESKMTMKPKGVGMGNPNKKKMYSTKPNMEGGFKTVKKKVNKTMGTGKAKFEYKEGENLEGKMKVLKPTTGTKKMETKEAARTYGKGSKSGRGLRKAITPNRNLTFESTSNEVQILREKNDEYRKALNVFRNKLNEVAVFNSNLAYATRLFTEHSTSKQEKINILRRFDGVETLKESKNLYKSIKDELSVKTSQPMNESIERKIENVQVTGSAVNLIESKTYENPQFLRMKDLMAKIK
jgi:hypothetical protein